MTPSRIGMLISAGILLAVVAVIVYVMLPVGIGPPTIATTAAGALDAITIDADPTQVVAIPPNGPGDAANIYNEMVSTAIGQGDWHDFADFMTKVNTTSDPQKDPKFSTILTALQSAATQPMPDGDLVFDKLKVTPLSDFGCRDVLYGIGKMAGKAARSYRDAGDKETSRKILESDFIFGWRLWHNGPYRGYRQAALAVMSEGAASLGSLLGATNDTAKSRIDEDFDHALDDAGQKWNEKEKNTIRKLAPVPGDMGNLALHDKDRSWRIEGIMWLGVAKWTSAGGKQREAIQKFLEEQSHASDKLYAETAKAAAAFSESDKNQIPVD